jgi:hypothetical protein
MAFEYLMIHFLLTLQLDKLVAELGRLDDFGYRDLPRHYEEALVRYQYQPDSRPVELRGRRIRPETARRFAQFVELVNRGGLASAADRQALRRDFGNTYWYYHLFAQAAGPPQSPPPAKP